MLNTYIIPDPATVPDDYDLAAELTARGLPAQWVSGHDARLFFYDQAHGYDTEEDGGDALVWDPDTEEVWYLSQGDVEAARQATPGVPFTHLRYSYFIRTESVHQDLDALQHEGLICLTDGTDTTSAIDVLDVYGEFGNLAYPGEMIVYDHGALYDAIPKEVCDVIKATA